MQIEKSKSTVFTALEDGGGVLLHVETLLYYRLNRTAAGLWREVEQSPRSTADLAGQLVEQYKIGRLRAESDVNAFVQDLERFKMIQTSV